MTDIWPARKRSQVMARIKGSDTGPEVALRTALNEFRVRFSTRSTLPGSPDIVIRNARLAVFVHGCFWHGCPYHYRPPKSRKAYWSHKLAMNKARDEHAKRDLRRLGWRVFVAWECQVRRNPTVLADRIHRLVTSAG